MLRFALLCVSVLPQLGLAQLVSREWQGQRYGCRCYTDDECWPKAPAWKKLNDTVEGNLLVHVPPEAACHNTFDGPLGSIETYNEAACACLPTDDPTSPCSLGYYGVYVIDAHTKEHVQAGVNFARENNLRLIIRNTGHDFIGKRSTGYGALIIRTHSFQEIEFIEKYRGPGCYRGRAVKLGAGAQGRNTLREAHAQDPPQAMLTGECPTVGLVGGLVQGGGHGPWSPLKGMTADTALSFDLVTADGEFKTANAGENSDLYWALKGGGPGNFAVVLSATFKTWNDLPSAGAYMFMNFTTISDPDVYWEGIRIFHGHASRMTSAGLYVYFELGELMLRVLPFVAINKSQKELDLLTQPLLDDLRAADVPFEYASSEYPTFFDLYTTMFEDEGPAHALTGGWTFTHEDVDENNDEIVAALRNAVNPREDLMGQGFLVGHFFDAGHTVTKPSSATHPAFRRSVNLIITTLPVTPGASLEERADLENLLTHVIDEPLRQLGKNGCAYVNEADPYQDNWQQHFWGSNYERLFEIKKKWDPNGVFYAIATPGAEEWESIEYGTRLCKPLN
ncbi:hypothetical protein NLU13_7614 [Sarocladium strictum]|uniref:FAD-binding PCMH-type domain-containing protein n=1 Tax=Sarocladium strictum TaxID=5046 RepID=A0AA39GDP3_SARSR|nr:hypothetical protein NLU13_7614 [Sarocladium strictum]